ncbi:T9SS type A sorting domain-containing protein [bacterium]|nr:T9SS type A sorting domain-containing protein [bacterium]
MNARTILLISAVCLVLSAVANPLFAQQAAVTSDMPTNLVSTGEDNELDDQIGDHEDPFEYITIHINGIMWDVLNDQPLPQFLYYLDGIAQRTNDDGEFTHTLFGLNHTITFDHPRFDPQTIRVRDIGFFDDPFIIEVVSAQVSGFVRDQYNDAVLPDFTFQYSDGVTPQNIRTDENGFYLFRTRTGSHSFHVDVLPFDVHDDTLDIQPNEFLEYDLNLVSGEVNGTISNFNTGEILMDVPVDIVGLNLQTISDAEGNYSIQTRTAQQVVHIDHYPYAEVLDTVEIVPLEAITHDLQLRAGILSVLADSLNATIDVVDEVIRSVWLRNDGSATIDGTVRSIPLRNAHRYLYIVREVSSIDALNDNALQGINFVNGRFYISGANNQSNPNRISVMNWDMEQVGGFGQPGSQYPGADEVGFRDMAYDGEVLWGGMGNELVSFYPELGREVSRIVGPFEQNIAMAWDPIRELLWVMGDGTDMVGINTIDGEIMATIPMNDLNVKAMTWYSGQRDGYRMFLSVQEFAGDRMLYRMNMETGEYLRVTALSTHQFPSRILGIDIVEGIYGDVVYLAGILDSDRDHIYMWEIDTFTGWAIPDPIVISIPPEDSIEVQVSFTPWRLPNDTYEGFLFGQHNTVEGESRLPMTLVLNRETDVDDDDQALPLKFALNNPYPNPFNPSTTIPFTIPERTEVSLIVYDLLGRETAVLHRGGMTAGKYMVTLNGSQLSSGVYFIKLTTGSDQAVRKIVLLK